MVTVGDCQRCGQRFVSTAKRAERRVHGFGGGGHL